MFQKQEIFRTIVIIWLVGSVVYIASDIWNDYKIKGINQAYQNGAEALTKQIFNQSEANGCGKTVELKLGEEKMELIDAKCLPDVANSSPQAASENNAK